MSNDRKDNKGRKLHSGEMQLKTGQYRFKYTDALGKARYCYSWRLTKNGYKTVINVLKNDSMGNALISKIRISEFCGLTLKDVFKTILKRRGIRKIEPCADTRIARIWLNQG